MFKTSYCDLSYPVPSPPPYMSQEIWESYLLTSPLLFQVSPEIWELSLLTSFHTYITKDLGVVSPDIPPPYMSQEIW